jgi:anaerobic selenocysteine-containing dehydrogenase
VLPHFSPLAPSGDANQFPLLFVTYQKLNVSHDFYPNPPFLNKTIFDFVLNKNDILIDVNPETARSAGLKEGDVVSLVTPQAEMRVRVHLSSGARPGVVYMIQGLGHTAYDEYIQNKGDNANRLIEVQMDPVTGLGTFWATRAQLRRV